MAGAVGNSGAYADYGEFHTHRNSFLTTTFSPDHTSLTAHTFTSTYPIGSATSRITSSVTLDATPDAFFGHDTHNGVSGLSFPRSAASSFASRARSVTNRCARSTPAPARLVNVTPSGMGSSRLRYPAGASMHSTLHPAVMPSFFASGVPE